MCAKSDEQILYECFNKLAMSYMNNKKHVPLSSDKKHVSTMMSNISVLKYRLIEDQMITSVEIRKSIITAKGYFVQLHNIKGRNPECVYTSLEKSLDTLIKAVCKHEAEMISLLRLQEIGGDRIDISEIFSKNKYLHRLCSYFAVDIIRDAIKDPATVVGTKNNKAKWYITETGKKYHIVDCPYCKGKNVFVATKGMIENQRLEPCKCVEKATVSDDHSCVTAFIDESIHSAKWTEDGKYGSVGSFSYILCWGNLSGESYIKEENVIAKGVDYVTESEHIHRITEAAIGKVMISLIYDFDFKGSLQIFTDNMTAATEWTENSKNSKLAEHFESVAVNHIPREKNTQADALGRNSTFLCMPTDVYFSVVKKVENFDKLKLEREKEIFERRRAEIIEEEKRQNRWINRFIRWIQSFGRQLLVGIGE